VLSKVFVCAEGLLNHPVCSFQYMYLVVECIFYVHDIMIKTETKLDVKTVGN
jgi:hypothetical protein